MEDQIKKRTAHLTVVTDSELTTWRSCHQLHDFRYRQRLRPKVAAKALTVGSIFHGGMSSGLRAGWDATGRSIEDLDLRVNRQIVVATAGIDAKVMEWAGTLISNGKELNYEQLKDDVDETAKMVKWMLAHYFREARHDLQQLELIATERPFDVPMVDIRGNSIAHLRHQGVRDAELYDPEFNAIVLYEHKTSGSHPSALEKRVEMDTQTAGYLNSLKHARQAGMVTMTGREVPKDARLGRVVWNVLRKEYPRPPKVNKNGSVSVAACVTTHELYELAIMDQVGRGIPMSDDQKEFLANLSKAGDRFYGRIEWHRTKAEIERWRSDAVVDARRIREADRDPSCRTRNTGNCNNAWSLPCSYRGLCLDPTAAEIRAQFSVADDVHTEVREAETEVAA
jgi:hypothetical protein